MNKIVLMFVLTALALPAFAWPTWSKKICGKIVTQENGFVILGQNNRPIGALHVFGEFRSNIAPANMTALLSAVSSEKPACVNVDMRGTTSQTGDSMSYVFSVISVEPMK